MNEYDVITARINTIEERLNAVIDLLNDLIELIYEPEYVRKLDRLAEYGEKEAVK